MFVCMLWTDRSRVKDNRQRVRVREREWMSVAWWYRNMGSQLSIVSILGRWSVVGHWWVVGASVAITTKHESALPKQTKANQVLIQCTQELIELESIQLTSREHPRDPRSCQCHRYRRSWRRFQWGNRIHEQHPPGRCSTCGSPRDGRGARRSRRWPTLRQRGRQSHWQPLQTTALN